MKEALVKIILTACIEWFLGRGLSLSYVLMGNEELKKRYKKFDDIGAKANADLDKAKELIKQLKTKEAKDEASDKAADDFLDSLRPR